MDDFRIDRVVFNFTCRCNMNCRFCYIPFDGKSITFERASDTLEVIIGWGVASITFGGGDPLMYPWIPRLIARARTALGPEAFLQLDTNGLGLSRFQEKEFLRQISLVGLPLESVNASVNKRLRDDGGFFKRICATIGEIEKAGCVALKINTVVTRENLTELSEVARSIAYFRTLKIWSLYEYWPLADTALRSATSLSITTAEFLANANEARRHVGNCEVEIGTVQKRWKSYLFVTPTGRAYATDPNDPGKYTELGDVFEKDCIVKWKSIVNRERNSERLRERAQALH